MAGSVQRAYEAARERYAAAGVDTESALKRLEGLRLSIQCWQADDVKGFENVAAASGGGIQVTGDHPGRARDADEVRADLERVFSLVPAGRAAANLHAMYGEFDGAPVDRDAIEERHFARWIDWAKARRVGLDFNATCFAHPRADAGFTLSSKDAGIREFWMEHVRRCRAVGAAMGRALGEPCVHNLWIPDGMKDTTIDRAGYRAVLVNSLDSLFGVKHDVAHLRDAVEAKLFGIGSEAYVVGSHEFYLGYAVSRQVMPCLDMGHFHPTESVADKVSSLLQFVPEVLLHVSRGVRWDSDHIVLFDDPTRDVAHAVVRAEAMERVHVAMDFFDATVTRPGALVAGSRATLMAFLYALLEPVRRLKELEESGDYLGRLGVLEAMKTMPFGAVWDAWCERRGVPVGEAWLAEIAAYERDVLAKRG